MSDDVTVKPGITIPGWEIWTTASRSGGPGGQHANKTSSRVTIFWDVANTTALTEVQRDRVMRRLASRINTDGVLQIDVGETRSQHQNRELAHRRLAEIVLEALKVKKRRVATRPSKSAERRRLKDKKVRAQIKKLRSPPKGDD